MHVPLTELGLAQAHDAAIEVARLCDGGSPAALFSSDQRRAAQTAEVIAEQVSLPIRFDVRLREQAMGQMEGKLATELKALPVPDGEHISEVSWSGSETIQAVWLRVTELLSQIRTEFPDGDVVLVSHGDTLHVVLAAAEGVGHRDVQWGRIRNAELRVCELPAAPRPLPFEAFTKRTRHVRHRPALLGLSAASFWRPRQDRCLGTQRRVGPAQTGHQSSRLHGP